MKPFKTTSPTPQEAWNYGKENTCILPLEKEAGQNRKEILAPQNKRPSHPKGEKTTHPSTIHTRNRPKYSPLQPQHSPCKSTCGFHPPPNILAIMHLMRLLQHTADKKNLWITRRGELGKLATMHVGKKGNTHWNASMMII